MSARLLAWTVLVLLAFVALAWWRPAWLPAPVRAVLPAGHAALPAGTAGAGAGARPRKCRGPGGVAYTQDACPSGMREEAMDGGTVTVLPAAPALAPAASAAASSPLRRWAGADDPQALQERRIERAVQGQP